MVGSEGGEIYSHKCAQRQLRSCRAHMDWYMASWRLQRCVCKSGPGGEGHVLCFINGALAETVKQSIEVNGTEEYSPRTVLFFPLQPFLERNGQDSTGDSTNIPTPLLVRKNQHHRLLFIHCIVNAMKLQKCTLHLYYNIKTRQQDKSRPHIIPFRNSAHFFLVSEL